MTIRKLWPILTVPVLLAGLAACSDSGRTALDDTNDPRAAEQTVLASVTPDGPLQPATDYVVHLGGNMMDADGEHVNMEEHGQQMGGGWATDDMMMGGGMSGMDVEMDPSGHMGGNWDHPSNGSHGMIFTFTTAG